LEIDANGALTTLRALSCYCVVRDGKSGKEVRGEARGRVRQLWWCSVVAGHEWPNGGAVFGREGGRELGRWEVNGASQGDGPAA
jgi:hypothetical protein